jgi:hypothetical protein
VLAFAVEKDGVAQGELYRSARRPASVIFPRTISIALSPRSSAIDVRGCGPGAHQKRRREVTREWDGVAVRVMGARARRAHRPRPVGHPRGDEQYPNGLLPFCYPIR